jgi:hypothetical protein
VVAHDDPERRERAENADAVGRDTELLVRFPERGVDGRFTGIDSSARQADLTGMLRQVVPANRQRQLDLSVVGVEEEQGRRAPGIRRLHLRAPALARRQRRKAKLRVAARQRLSEPRAQEGFDGREVAGRARHVTSSGW